VSGADLLEDSFSGHGTTAGYDAGCRSLGGCPGKDGPWAQTCMTAKSRSRMEFGYSKAVAKDREVEFLQAEADARTEAVKPTAKVAAAKRSQRKEHRVPVPTARPKPPAPTPVAEELQQWPDEAAPQPACAEPPAGSLAKSQGAFASHPKQRDLALATASKEHPMGLTLTGEPRRRCAPGTVLVEGVLRRSDDEANVLTPGRPVPEGIADGPEPTAPTSAPAADEQVVPAVEEPRPRGKRVLDDAVRTLTESLELQRALAGIGERALRTIRIEINHQRREIAAHENNEEE
jgi:hypothetical protein